LNWGAWLALRSKVVAVREVKLFSGSEPVIQPSSPFAALLNCPDLFVVIPIDFFICKFKRSFGSGTGEKTGVFPKKPSEAMGYIDTLIRYIPLESENNIERSGKAYLLKADAFQQMGRLDSAIVYLK
jgi:hypothetical protein